MTAAGKPKLGVGLSWVSPMAALEAVDPCVRWHVMPSLFSTLCCTAAPLLWIRAHCLHPRAHSNGCIHEEFA